MSKTISVETTINAPLNKVWDEVSQINNHSNWMKDAVKIDFESELRSGIGTKIKVLTKIGPFKLYDYMTFTKWEENKTIGVDHVGIVTGKGELKFRKIDEYTTNFKWTETLKLPIYLGGPIGEVFGEPILKLIWKEEPLDVEESIATETTENIEPIQINEDILWTKGVGKSPEEFISNWNKLINSISNDEETIMFFSINPDGVNWVSDAQQTLVYQFGKSTAKENIFVLNLNVDNDSVRSLEFFAPTSNDEITSQQTKLFFLMIISISDDALDKDQRESILVDLGLYEEVVDPNEYGGVTIQNQIEYELQPKIVTNKLIGINFYSRIPFG